MQTNIEPVHIGNELYLYKNGNLWDAKKQTWVKQYILGGYLTFGGELGWVHRLLVTHYKSEIPKGMAVNHIDGNKLNNDLDNLEIVTYSQNMLHAYANNLVTPPTGEINGMAKLTNDEYIGVAHMLSLGYDNDTIAEHWGLHSRYVSLVRHGRRWKEMYKHFGPFPKVVKDTFKDKYEQFLKLKDTHRNKEIAIMLNVDASTVSRWRSGETKH